MPTPARALVCANGESQSAGPEEETVPADLDLPGGMEDTVVDGSPVDGSPADGDTVVDDGYAVSCISFITTGAF